MKQLLPAGLLALALLPASGVDAEIVRQTFEPFPLERGVTILYDTHQFAQLTDAYTTRIRFGEVLGDVVFFDWAMYGYTAGQGRTSVGSSIIQDLDGCRYLDPWWPGGAPEAVMRQRCELWVGRDVFDELKREGRALFQLDFTARKDAGVEVVIEETITYEVRIDGRPVELPALRLRSSMDDHLIVYDDPDNPFVLEAMLPHIYEWNVTDIYVSTEPPPAVEPSSGAVLSW